MWNEIEKLQLKKGVWQNLLEAALPLDNAKVEIEYPDNHTLYFRITENGEPVGKSALSFLYGCKGVLVSHTMLVEEAYRNRGIAKKIREVEMRVARDLKATVILCTVRDDNTAYEQVIKKWDRVGSFVNKRTEAKVNIWTRKVE